MSTLQLVLLLLLRSAGRCAQDTGEMHFICRPAARQADVCASGPHADPRAEELRGALVQLRESALQQKDTIRELTAKLSRCESQKKPTPHKDTMGDVWRSSAGDTLTQLTHTLHTLKLRLDNLEVSRNNASAQTHSLRELLQNKMDKLERQVLSRVSSLEEEKRLRNKTEQQGGVESSLTNLQERVNHLEKGQKDNRPRDEFQLTFPLRTNYMYARLRRSLPELFSFTVCLWLRSGATPGVGTPFSYAVPGQANELVLIEWGNNPMEMLINDKVAKLPFLINDGKWHHICVWWTTRDGVWEAYQDGALRGNGENLAPYHPIKPQGVLVLGQEQDLVGGGFDATQAFVGELANFNLWDRKLSQSEIYSLSTCSSRAQTGNVCAWNEENLEVHGGTSKWNFQPCRSLS